MKDLNGLQTAEFIRQLDKNVILIFMTGYDKFVYQGYEVKAFRYILKINLNLFILNSSAIQFKSIIEIRNTLKLSITILRKNFLLSIFCI